MKPNLKSYNATLLEFHTTLPLTGDLISKIRSASPPDEEGDSPFIDSYQGHNAYVWVIEVDKGVDKDKRRFSIHFRYEVGRGRKPSKKNPLIEELVDILSSIKGNLAFDCQVNFVFRKRLKARSIISLPMKYVELPNMPFDRIQGLHLVKLDGSETKYDIILDSPSSGTIIETLFFHYSSRVDKTLAEKILREAMTISDRFVLRGQ